MHDGHRYTGNTPTEGSAARWWLAIGAVALLVAGLAAVLVTAAAQGYLTQPVTRLLSAQLGRELNADGGLRIRIGRVTRLTAIGVRLANSKWAQGADMLRARSVILELDTRSLWSDTLIVRRLNVDGLELRLERNDQGEANWNFDLHRNASKAGFPIVLNLVSMPGAQISFRGPRLVRPLAVTLAVLEQRESGDGMLEFRAEGLANATPLFLRMNVGPFANLVEERDFRLKAEGQLGQLALTASGHVDSPTNPVDTELSMSVQAPDAAYFAEQVGLRDFGTGALALDLAVQPLPSGGGVQGRLAGQVGEFAVKAAGSMVGKKGVTEYNVQAELAGPDLARVGRLMGVKGLPTEAFRFHLDGQRAGALSHLRTAALEFADVRLAAEGTLGGGKDESGAELSFRASAADLGKLARRFGFTLPLVGPIDLTGKVRRTNPAEVALDCKATATYGTFSAAGSIPLAADHYGTRLTVTASGGDFRPLATALGLPDPPRGAYRSKGEIEWRQAGLLLRGVTLEAEGETLAIDGALGRPALTAGTDLRVEISGASAARTGERFGVKGFPAAAYHVAGRIQRQQNRWLLAGLKAKLAAATMQLDGVLGASPRYLATNLAFTVNGASLTEFSGLLSGIELPRSPFRAAGNVTVGNDDALHLFRAQVTVGDSTSTLSLDLGLPFDASFLRFDVEAAVPDPMKLFVGVGGAQSLGNNLHISAAGQRLGEQWSFDRLRIGSDIGLINVRGAITLLPEFSAQNAQFEMNTPSLRRTGLASSHRWPDVALQLAGRITTTRHEVLISELSGRFGAGEFTGRVAARGSPDQPDYDVQLAFTRLDFDPLLDRQLSAATPAPAATGKAGDASRRVIPDKALSLPPLNAFTGSINLRAQSLRLEGKEYHDLKLQSALKDGRLQLNSMEITGQAGQLNMRGTLSARGNGMLVQVSASGSNLALRPVPFGPAGPGEAAQFAANADLQAAGGTLRELAATLNGRVRLVGRGGRVTNSLLSNGSNSFRIQLLRTLNPMATRQPTTDVDCAVYLLRVRDGIVTTDPTLVLRTREVNIVSVGSVDLHTERIDFNFKNTARTGLGFGLMELVNPYVKVTGTLASPGLTLDPTGALVNGGAAFATAGLSVVATTLWDRFVQSGDPCAAAVAEFDRRALGQQGAH